jgi:hypothetical protein
VCKEICTNHYTVFAPSIRIFPTVKYRDSGERVLKEFYVSVDKSAKTTFSPVCIPPFFKFEINKKFFAGFHVVISYYFQNASTFSSSDDLKKRANAAQNFRLSSLFYYSVPPERLEIESEVGEEENSISNISCTARGIYPTPQGKLSWTEG